MVGAGPGAVGSKKKVPIGGLGSHPEAEAKCEISVQFVMFSCTKFRI